MLYSATGDGSVVCVNARTGEPIWRVPLFKAGINATVLVHNHNKVIAVYGTPYEPGQMVALKITDVAPTNAAAAPIVLDRSVVQLWAEDLSTSSSSPILAGDTIYLVTEKGDLAAVDANKGGILWRIKLGIEERNSCPLFADGKIYVPMLDDPASKSAGSSEAGTSGAFYVIKPGTQPEILNHVALDGRCFGTPTAYNGKIYMQTTRHIYCFGKKGNNSGLPSEPEPEKWPAAGPATALQVIPSEVVLRPGQKANFHSRTIDAKGFPVQDVKDANALKWVTFIPPTAKVKSSMKASFDAEGALVAANDTIPSAGAFEGTYENVKGYIRGRVLPYLPVHQDFESFTLAETNSAGQLFSYPPLPWIGARFKFEIRDKDANKVLTKTIDNKFFQRAMVFFGAPDASNYTIDADVMSDGNRRKMSDVGIINQRYLIVLKGNEQRLEINSNLERFRVFQDFKWQAGVWYRLKARVDVADDGTGIVRAKVWKKEEPEPEKWTMESPHHTAHRNGSPGLFGFSPQDMPVYIDNITVQPN